MKRLTLWARKINPSREVYNSFILLSSTKNPSMKPIHEHLLWKLKMALPSFPYRVSRTDDLQLFYWRRCTSVPFHLKLLKTSGESRDKLFNIVLWQSHLDAPLHIWVKTSATCEVCIFTYSYIAFNLSSLGRGLILGQGLLGTLHGSWDGTGHRSFWQTCLMLIIGAHKSMKTNAQSLSSCN